MEQESNSSQPNSLPLNIIDSTHPPSQNNCPSITSTKSVTGGGNWGGDSSSDEDDNKSVVPKEEKQSEVIATDSSQAHASTESATSTQVVPSITETSSTVPPAEENVALKILQQIQDGNQLSSTPMLSTEAMCNSFQNMQVPGQSYTQPMRDQAIPVMEPIVHEQVVLSEIEKQVYAHEEAILEDLDKTNLILKKTVQMQQYPLNSGCLFYKAYSRLEFNERPTPDFFLKLDQASDEVRRNFAASILSKNQINTIIRMFEMEYINPTEQIEIFEKERAEKLEMERLEKEKEEVEEKQRKLHRQQLGLPEIANPPDLMDTMMESNMELQKILVGLERIPYSQEKSIELALALFHRYRWIGGGCSFDDRQWVVQQSTKLMVPNRMFNTIDEIDLDSTPVDNFMSDISYIMERFITNLYCSFRRKAIKGTNRVLIIFEFMSQGEHDEKERRLALQDSDSSDSSNHYTDVDTDSSDYESDGSSESDSDMSSASSGSSSSSGSSGSSGGGGRNQHRSKYIILRKRTQL
jgi:uncharacterized membrane protein YgcG